MTNQDCEIGVISIRDHILSGSDSYINKIRAWKLTDLPEPEMIELDGGFNITLFKAWIFRHKLPPNLAEKKSQKRVIIFQHSDIPE